MDRNDLFGQYPVVDAICDHLENRNLLALASVCKGTAQFRDVCMIPRLKSWVQIAREYKNKLRDLPLAVIFVDHGFVVGDILVCFRPHPRHSLSGPRIFLNRRLSWHYASRAIVVRSCEIFPTFESFVRWLLGRPKTDALQYEWVP
jgi:hypothetical protein